MQFFKIFLQGFLSVVTFNSQAGVRSPYTRSDLSFRNSWRFVGGDFKSIFKNKKMLDRSIDG